MNLSRNKIFNYLSLFMAFFYVILGMWVYKYKMISLTDEVLNIGAGLLLVVYGGFRGYRAFMCIREMNLIDDEQNAK